MLALLTVQTCNPITQIPDQINSLNANLQLSLTENDIINLLEREISQLNIPELTVTVLGFDITISKISIDEFNYSAIFINITHDLLQLSMRDQLISVSTNLKIKQKKFPYIKDEGHAYIDINVELIKVTVSSIKGSCNYHINFKLTDQKVAVADLEIKIKSTFSAFLQPFMNTIQAKLVEFFNGEKMENILNGIEEPINDILNNLLPLTFNKDQTIDTRIVNCQEIFQDGMVVMQMFAQFCYYDKEENICQNEKIQQHPTTSKNSLLALSLDSFNSGLNMFNDEVIVSMFLVNFNTMKIIYAVGDTEDLNGIIMIEHDGLGLKFYFNLEVENEQIQNICKKYAQVFLFDFGFTDFEIETDYDWLYINGVQ